MALSPVDARVLACLIEKEITVPDSYPLTLNALRSACNQSSNRNPVTSYDDRTIDDALGALKSLGLVRFVHPSHGGRTLRYRHVADEHWGLGRGELGVLAMLILRGPETEATLRARAEKHLLEGGVTVEEALRTLTSHDPEPFVARLERRAGEREPRYVQLLVDGTHDEPLDGPDNAGDDDAPVDAAPVGDGLSAGVGTRDDVGDDAGGDRDEQGADGGHDSGWASGAPGDEVVELVEALIDEVAELRRRVERLERLYDG